LIPQPRNAEEEQKFADDVRQGGFSGKVTVGSDLNTFTLG
jgi:ribonuclease Z